MGYEGAYDGSAEEQALAWIAEVTGREPPSGGVGLIEALRDGVALCELANAISPGSVPRASRSRSAFAQRDNIGAFLGAARGLGLKDFDVFEIADLFGETPNASPVLNTVCALGKLSLQLPFFAGPCLVAGADSAPGGPPMQRTFSSNSYEQMLQNPALTDTQRQQLMKMKDKRSRVEEEQKFTDEGIRSYLRGRRSTSSSALLGALEEQDTLEGQLASLPGRGRTSTAALQSHLQDTRDEMGRLTTLADMHKELGAVQQHLAELRAELGIVPEEPHSSAADNLAPDGPVPTASAVDALRPVVEAEPGPRGLRILGMGVGGIGEMVSMLLDDCVQFGLIKFELGTGTFTRDKYVFVQYAGPAAPAVRRGRHVGQASFVKEAMGGAHATMVFSEPEDATVDAVLTRLLSIMTADDGEYSLADLKSLIEAQIAKAQLAADVGGDGRHVRTAAEMANHDFGWRECLKYVASSHGPFNWLLVEPNVDNPRLYNSGSGSVMEMVEWLDTSKVLYGLVRMSFGTGQFRRTKWVWLQWSGDDVGAMQRSRGVYGGVVEGMQRLLSPYQIELHAGRPEEVTAEVIIEHIKKIIVSDGDFSDKADMDMYSMENFYSALAEEDAAAQEFFQDEVVEDSHGEMYGADGTFDGCVHAVRGTGPLNWVVCRL